MPKLLYALLSTDLIIDKDSSSTSFIRTVEHAVVPELPTVLPPIYFGSLWDLEGNEGKPFTVSLTLVPPAGDPLVLGSQEIKPGTTMLHKMNFQLPGLKVNTEGKHLLAVGLKDGDDWITQSELPLFVFKGKKKAKE